MSSIPVETVVELLMAEVMTPIDGGCVVWVGKRRFHSASVEGLRTSVREYLLTLVPQPKLLSECEEGEWFDSIQPVQRYAGRAYNPMGLDIGRASDFQVIQPVEVQK